MADVWPPKIESGIPRQQVRGKWTFVTKMNVGDSFFWPGHSTREAPAAFYHVYEKHGFKFECRNVTENGIMGVRSWRID